MSHVTQSLLTGEAAMLIMLAGRVKCASCPSASQQPDCQDSSWSLSGLTSHTAKGGHFSGGERKRPDRSWRWRRPIRRKNRGRVLYLPPMLKNYGP